MRNFSPILILLLSLILIHCKQDDSGKNTGLKGWILAGNNPQNYSIGIETGDAHHGQKSGFIESKRDTSLGFGTLMQICDASLFAGKRIRMTGYIESLAGESSIITMWARIDDYVRQITADFDNMDDRPLTGTNLWTKCVIVFDVPSNQSTLNFGLILAPSGKAWFDDISFEVVDSTVPKTAVFVNQPYNFGNFPENLPVGPINLDFEE
jgi:hypothetical protein